MFSCLEVTINFFKYVSKRIIFSLYLKYQKFFLCVAYRFNLDVSWHKIICFTRARKGELVSAKSLSSCRNDVVSDLMGRPSQSHPNHMDYGDAKFPSGVRGRYGKGNYLVQEIVLLEYVWQWGIPFTRISKVYRWRNQ